MSHLTTLTVWRAAGGEPSWGPGEWSALWHELAADVAAHPGAAAVLTPADVRRALTGPRWIHTLEALDALFAAALRTDARMTRDVIAGAGLKLSPGLRRALNLDAAWLLASPLDGHTRGDGAVLELVGPHTLDAAAVGELLSRQRAGPWHWGALLTLPQLRDDDRRRAVDAAVGEGQLSSTHWAAALLEREDLTARERARLLVALPHLWERERLDHATARAIMTRAWQLDSRVAAELLANPHVPEAWGLEVFARAASLDEGAAWPRITADVARHLSVNSPPRYLQAALDLMLRAGSRMDSRAAARVLQLAAAGGTLTYTPREPHA